jgi:hypothetical protein
MSDDFQCITQHYAPESRVLQKLNNYVHISGYDEQFFRNMIKIYWIIKELGTDA